jgi:hypothetical protein
MPARGIEYRQPAAPDRAARNGRNPRVVGPAVRHRGAHAINRASMFLRPERRSD